MQTGHIFSANKQVCRSEKSSNVDCMCCAVFEFVVFPGLFTHITINVYPTMTINIFRSGFQTLSSTLLRAQQSYICGAESVEKWNEKKETAISLSWKYKSHYPLFYWGGKKTMHGVLLFRRFRRHARLLFTTVVQRFQRSYDRSRL